MARSNKFDDLDEMLVPQETTTESSDDISGPKKESKPKQVKKADASKPPYILEKEAKARKEKTRLIVISVLIFALMIGALIGVGFIMGERAGVDWGASARRPADPDRTQFHNEDALPELSTEGVKGTLTEAYFTKSGDLAITVSLSNGTGFTHELVSMNATIFNGDGDNVAVQNFTKFKPAVQVPAGGYGSAYLVIDKENVLLPEDSLGTLGTTLEIGSKPIEEKEEETAGEGPKDIAPGRTFFEAPGNIPALSEEGVKGTVIRARYTNDGSLAVTLSLSNGMDSAQQVTAVNVDIKNGDGQTIGQENITTFATPCVVQSKSYNELDVIIDTANVAIKDDSLNTLTCTVSVGTGPVAEQPAGDAAGAVDSDAPAQDTPAAQSDAEAAQNNDQ